MDIGRDCTNRSGPPASTVPVLISTTSLRCLDPGPRGILRPRLGQSGNWIYQGIRPRHVPDDAWTMVTETVAPAGQYQVYVNGSPCAIDRL